MLLLRAAVHDESAHECVPEVVPPKSCVVAVPRSCDRIAPILVGTAATSGASRLLIPVPFHPCQTALRPELRVRYALDLHEPTPVVLPSVSCSCNEAGVGPIAKRTQGPACRKQRWRGGKGPVAVKRPLTTVGRGTGRSAETL